MRRPRTSLAASSDVPLVRATTILTLALVSPLGACAATPLTTPRSRVAQDLGCSPERTTVEPIVATHEGAAGRWQVRGCGKAAVYLCTTPVRDCWREGAVTEADLAAPPSSASR
jgi:hypothetical protein